MPFNNSTYKQFLFIITAYFCYVLTGLISSTSTSYAGETEEFGEVLGIDNLCLTAGLQYGRIEGNTTYNNFTSSNSESKLEFPLANSLAGFEIVLGYKDSDQALQPSHKVTLKTFTNHWSDAGKMKDSDWISDVDDVGYIGEVHKGLDIYSESDAQLRLNINDLNYIYNFTPAKGLTFGGLIGYRYQKLRYEIRDSNQVGYGLYEI